MTYQKQMVGKRLRKIIQQLLSIFYAIKKEISPALISKIILLKTGIILR